MKKNYISPNTYTLVVNSRCGILAGSTGDAVSSNGDQINLDGYKSDGDAGNAAARGGMWDDEEE